MDKQQKGTTLSQLFGVVVMVLSGVLPPLLAEDHSPGEAVAHYTARDIGRALIKFHEDLGLWPNLDAQGESGLLTLISGDGSRHAPSASSDLLGNHLAVNQPSGRENYPEQGDRAWRGPYLNALGLDPWGHPYVVHMTALADDPPVGANKAVVVSLGPNGRLETPAVMDRNARFGGDDIGMAFFVRDEPEDFEFLTASQDL